MGLQGHDVKESLVATQVAEVGHRHVLCGVAVAIVPEGQEVLLDLSPGPICLCAGPYSIFSCN